MSIKAGRVPRSPAFFIAAILCAAPVFSTQAAPDAAAPSNAIVREGIAIEFEMVPADPGGKPAETFKEGDLVRFRFKIRDTNSDTPLSGVYPAAWMDLRSEAEKDAPQLCREKVEAFIGGSLFAPPELDLNVYYVLALNDDASISVVDPLFGFGTTKLLDMVFLENPGEDWALTSDQNSLFVSMPDSNKVAVADTSTWKVVTNLATGKHPSRVKLQPDEHYLWTGYDEPAEGADLSGVTVIDAGEKSVVKNIATGRGHHEIAFSADSRFAFVTNQDDGTLSIIDVRKLEPIERLDAGKEPVSIAYSTAARAAYVVSRRDGAITVVDGETHATITRIQAEPGLGQIKFGPDGRLGFVVNGETNVLHILDASVNRIIQTGGVEDGPDQVAFSDNLAYIRHRNSELILMVPLEKVGQEGQPIPVVDFPGGQRPFGRGSKPSPADAIVVAPGATAVLVANAGDRSIYYYKEGMAAPMGNFQNYSREPRAVLAVDRSLRERSPGSYETVAQLRSPGVYDVAFFLDSPRTTHCFTVQVASNPELEAQRLREHPIQIEPITVPQNVPVGSEAVLQFRLTYSSTGALADDLANVSIVTFRAPGFERKEHQAEKMGEGIYGVHIVPSHPGVYYAFVGIPSAGLNYNQSPFALLRAEQPPKAQTPPPAGGQAAPAQPAREDS